MVCAVSDPQLFQQLSMQLLSACANLGSDITSVAQDGLDQAVKTLAL